MDTAEISPLFHQLAAPDRLHLATRAPFAWLVTGEDRLRVTVANAAAGVTLTVSGRFLTADGDVVPFVETITPPTDRTLATLEAALGDGWLINLTARVTAGTPQAGDTFATVDVVRGAGAVAIVLGTLVAGYVRATSPIAWPGGEIQDSLSGAGSASVITGANPGAGAEASVAIPTGARFRLVAGLFTLTTDATAANREPFVRITAGGTLIQAIASGINHVASQTRRYSLQVNGARVTPAQGFDLCIPIPPVWLRAGDTVATVTTNLQAGDDWAAPSIYGDLYFDG